MDSKSRNDNLKRLFSDENANLPREFDWEQMEEGIMDKMNSLESANPPFSRQSWRIILALTLLMVILPVSNLMDNGLEDRGDLGILNQKAEPEISLSAPLSPSNLLSDQPSVDNTQLSTHTGKGQSKPIMRREKVSESKDIILLSLIEQDRVQTQTDAAIPDGIKLSDKMPQQELVLSNKDNLNSLPTYITNSPVTQETNASPTDAWELNQRIDTSISSEVENRYSATPLLPTLSFKIVDSNSSTKAKINPSIANASFNKQLKPSLRYQELSLVSGVSNWNMGYGSELPERQPYEQAILSYYTQLSYSYRFSNNLTLMAGLQYQQLETRLNWSAQLEDYTVIIKDTIIEIHSNSLTGEQVEVRGDAEVVVEATRNVRHYNQYRLVQIPLALGKSWKLSGNWYTSISIGAAVNIYGYNSGRNVWQGDLKDFKSPSTLFMDSRWNLHGMAMARLGYRINNKWGIMAQIDVQKSLTNWSTESNIQMKPAFINFGIGLSYSL